MKTTDKINFLNKDCKTNWEIRFHGDYVDINYPDSPVTPDYEDYISLDMALDEVVKDLLAQKEDRKECQCEVCCQLFNFYKTSDGFFEENICPKCYETPSPLEGFVEMKEITDKHDVIVFGRNPLDDTFLIIKNLNQVIRNQKKLYQYIKEKKI